MEERQEHCKIELWPILPTGSSSAAPSGEYVDAMCIGPHLTTTKALEGLQDHPTVGARWRT